MTRRSPRRIESALEDLEDAATEAPPEMFVAWGRAAGCTDDEIAAAWDRVVAETSGGRHPMAQAWIWDLRGREIFPTDGSDGTDGDGDA